MLRVTGLRDAIRMALGAARFACGLGMVAAVGIAGAAPAGGVVASGAASISTSGPVTTIQQSSGKVIIDWQSISIAPKEIVTFVQPGAGAIALNEVIGNEASLIQGVLNANGRVFLVNANGVLFTKGSSVNAAGFLASTLPISPDDFAADRLRFVGSPGAAAVVNDGALSAQDGGYVVLLGGSVSNRGVISASRGTVALAAGAAVSLNFNGDALVNVTIDEGSLQALVENGQAIYADGGRVLLSARAADGLLNAQVNNTGLVQARTLDDLVGDIRLLADGGTTHVGGVLDASAPSTGPGGTIDTSGTVVDVATGARVTTAAATGAAGLWRIDPDGFTIAASGGNITGAELGAQLANGNVEIQSTAGTGTSGDVVVNDVVSWAASTQLTLTATRDVVLDKAVTATGATAAIALDAGRNIEFNAPVTLTGDGAAVALNYGGFATTGVAADGTDYFMNNLSIGADGSIHVSDASLTISGSTASLSINGAPYQLIHDMAGLAAISPPVLDANGNVVIDPYYGTPMFAPAVGNFAIAQDIDASGVVFPYPVVNTLIGNLAGLGHKISNLKVASTTPIFGNQFEDAALIDYFGPGTDAPGQLRDLGLVGVSIVSGDGSQTGGVAAGLVAVNSDIIRNTYVTGTITGSQPVGGIAAMNAGTIVDSHVDVSIMASAAGYAVGGLVGENFAVVEQSTAKGTIVASAIDLHDGGGMVVSDAIGGLVGLNYAIVTDSLANVNVAVTNSFAVGGLVGVNFWGSSVSNSHALGNVDITWTNQMLWGQSYGGLVGYNEGGFISNSTASGSVTGRATGVGALPVTDVGGLVGTNDVDIFGGGGVISNSSASGAVRVDGAAWNVGGAVGTNLGTMSGVTASGVAVGGSQSQEVGGLVGQNYGLISDSFASGNVAGGYDVGALVGNNNSWATTGSITQSGATGFALIGGQQVGGLIGADWTGTPPGQVTYSNNGGAALGQAQADLAQGVRPEVPLEVGFATGAPLDASLRLEAPGLSVDVKSITVDGQTFDLLDETAPPSEATPAPRSPR